MKVSAEKLEGSRVVLTIEAPSSVVDESLDKAYKTVVKRVNVPGFRRGKAPRFILERHYGKEVLYEEAMREVLPAQYQEAVEQTKINPIDEPEFHDVNFKQGEPLTFKATVYVQPEVTLEDYESISVPYEVQPVTDEDVRVQIDFLKERMAELTPIPDGQGLERGDYATCRIKGLEGGSFAVNLDQDLSYVEVGKEYGIVPGLSEALVGMKKGETKEFTGVYPAGEGEESKSALFSVEVKECYRKRVPSDEEFLKNLAKNSLDEVRADVKRRLEAMRRDAARRAHSLKVEEAVLAKGKVEIPSVMVDRREHEMLHRFVDRLREADTSLEAYLGSTGKTIEDFSNEMRAEAEKEVRRELILDAIAEKENTVVPEETVNSVMESLAEQMGKDVDTVKTTLQFRGALGGIISDLRRFEVVKTLAMRAAEKAGTPLPPDDVKPVAGGDAGSQGAEPSGGVDHPESVSDTGADEKVRHEANEAATPEAGGPSPEAEAQAEVAATEPEGTEVAHERGKKSAKAE